MLKRSSRKHVGEANNRVIVQLPNASEPRLFIPRSSPDYSVELNRKAGLSFFFVGDVALLGNEGLVGLGVHELISLVSALLVELDANDPAAAVGVVLRDLVDGGGLLLKDGVGAGNLALDGGVDVGGTLDRLDGADGVALVDPVTSGLGELDVDNVTELLSSVLGDANDARLAVGSDINPLVVLGEALGQSYVGK